MDPWLGAGIALAGGLALGVVVTRNLHGNPKKRFWNERLGGTGFRRANIPVGGLLAWLISGVLAAAGLPSAAVIVAGAGMGMAAGAIGVGFADPLPSE